MKALSIRQPWAELILSGRKKYELRKWRTAFRGTIAIHAGLTIETADVISAGLAGISLVTGAVVGLVDVVDCVPFESRHAEELHAAGVYFREWPEARFAWVLTNPWRLPVPIPCKGKLGLFGVESVSPNR